MILYSNQRTSEQMNWEKIRDSIGLKLETYDPGFDLESVVHEFSHIYDCLGKAAYKWKGDEYKVAKLIEKNYPTEFEQDLHELRVSAITYLVLEPHTDKQAILDSACSNVNFRY